MALLCLPRFVNVLLSQAAMAVRARAMLLFASLPSYLTASRGHRCPAAGTGRNSPVLAVVLTPPLLSQACLTEQLPPCHTPAAAVMVCQKDNQQGPATVCSKMASRATLGYKV